MDINNNFTYTYLIKFIFLFAVAAIFGCAKKSGSENPPQVHITSPLPFKESTIPRSVEINADVKSTGGVVNKVEFFADGKLLPNGTVTKAPYKYLWNVTSGFGVLRKITVKTYDTYGITGQDTVSVKIWNGLIKAPDPISRYAFTSNTVNKKIYVIGGYNTAQKVVEEYDSAQKVVEEYDPTLDKWTRKASPQFGHAAHASCVINNIIYVFGGDKGMGWIPDVEAYNPATNMWTEKAPIPIDDNVAFGMMGCVAFNDKAYLIGGFSQSQQTRIGVYDPVVDSWTIKSIKNIFWPGIAAVGNQIFAFGGCRFRGIGICKDTSTSDQTQLYDPATGSFSTRAAMLYKQSAAAVSVVGGKIYVMGGCTADGRCMEVYDPAADKWAALPDMPLGAVNFSASVVGNNIYIISSKTLEYFTQ